MSRNTNNNNTNPEFMPKRNRPESIDVDDEFSDSSAPATQTPAAASAANVSGGDASSHPVTGADPHLERILSGLDIDADFKDSIRSMTPETRRDILNDIVRSQQHQESQTAMQQYMHTMVPPMFQGARTATMSNANPFQFSLAASLAAAAAGRGLGGDDTEPEFHYTLDIGENDMDEDEDEDEEFDGEEDSDEQNSQRAAAFTNFLRQLHQHGGGFPFQFLEQHLMNMRSELAQMRAMRDMGINRDIDDMSYEELLALEERMGSVSKGIASEATMQSCMTIAESAPKEGSCAVCLEEFSTPGAAQVCASLRNCGHHFHESCLKQWLGMEKTCPVCKQEVLPASSSSAPA